MALRAPRQLLPLIILQLLHLSSAFRFSFFPPFTGLNEILVGGNATKTEESLLLTPDSQYQVGRAIYSNPISLVNPASGTSASFSTSFTFRVTFTTSVVPGDGFAFFLTSTGDQNPPIDSRGEYLGLISPASDGQANSSLIAVEFDTFKNQYDDSPCHVGIDVNSVKKSISTVALPSPPGLSNRTLNSWIDYNSSSGILEVRLAEVNRERPQEPLLSGFLGPLSMILGSRVRAGFSASTGSDFEKHEVLAWNFSSGGFRKAPQFPAPSPSPLPSPVSEAPAVDSLSPPLPSPTQDLSPASPPVFSPPKSDSQGSPQPTPGTPSGVLSGVQLSGTIVSVLAMFWLHFGARKAVV